MAKRYNNKIDVIIPAYNVPDHILFRCLASIACQDIVKDLEVTIVDDASTEQNYHKVASCFESIMKIHILRYETNGGPGVARQYGIDHTSNGYMTFIDADDTFNGSLALKALRNGIEMNNGLYHTCVGVFDEIHEEGIPAGQGPYLMDHKNDLIWMFGKLYRRSFIEKYNIHFHETSKANEDNGFNTLIRLCSSDQEQINFIPAHVYYWHENPNSITRANDCEYSYGGSIKDSFYGYVENMIFAVKESKKRKPYNGFITMWAVNCMINIYEYYIECYARSRETADKNFLWCKRYYDEVYKALEPDISEQIFAEQYNDIMRNAYMGDKLNGIIPCMGVYEFLEKLRKEDTKNEEIIDAWGTIDKDMAEKYGISISGPNGKLSSRDINDDDVYEYVGDVESCGAKSYTDKDENLLSEARAYVDDNKMEYTGYVDVNGGLSLDDDSATVTTAVSEIATSIISN